MEYRALDVDVRALAGKKFRGVSFAKMDMTRLDLRRTSFLECDFTDADLSYSNCEGCNFWGSVFKRTRLYRTNAKDAIFASTEWDPRDTFGLTITTVCETFHGARVSRLWWNCCLFLLAQTQCTDPEAAEELQKLLPQETKEKLEMLFRVRVL